MDQKYNDNLKKLSQSQNMMDVLIQIEDFLDNLDLYAFANWFDGVIYEGPYVERYWVIFSLIYPYNKMPDPYGGRRLLKYGSTVTYEKITRIESFMPTPEKQNNTVRVQASQKKEVEYWLIRISIPRRYIETLYDNDIEEYENDIIGGADAASDARDDNIESDDSLYKLDDEDKDNDA